MSNFNARQGISVGSPAVNVIDASGNVTATSFTGPGTGLTAIPVTALATTGTASATTYLNGAGAYTTPATGSAASLTTALTGFAVGTDASQLAATDNILTGLQKLEAQENVLANQVASAQSSSLGNAIGPWISYTPIWTATGTAPAIGNGTLAAKYRRVGDSVEIEAQIYTGTTTTYGSGRWMISLPSGLTLDTTKISTSTTGMVNFGQFSADASVSAYIGIVTTNDAATLTFYCGQASVSSTFPFTWAANYYFALRATVPIAQWTANINLLTSFTEYAYNTSTTTTSDSTSFGYGSGGTLIQAFAPTGTAYIGKTVQFSQAIQATDLLTIEINTGNGWTTAESAGVGFSTNGTVNTGIIAQIASTNTVGVVFYSMGALNNTWAALNSAGWRWRVRKTSQGNFAQGSPSYSTTIGNASATSFTVTHNLGTPIYSVTAWETTGSLRQITSGVVVSNPTSTTVTLTFTTAPALNAVQVLVQSNGGTVSNNDRLSNLANPELTISAAATASTAQWNRCYATSAAYALTLPPVLASAGEIVGVRIDSSSTYNVTVTGTLDKGATSYLMVAGECCEFKSDGTTWQRISNNTVDGTWTPVAANLGGSSITYSTHWIKCGNKVDFNITAVGTNLVGTVNTTTLTIPFIPARYGACAFSAGGNGGNSGCVPMAFINVSGIVALPSFVATARFDMTGTIFLV